MDMIALSSVRSTRNTACRRYIEKRYKNTALLAITLYILGLPNIPFASLFPTVKGFLFLIAEALNGSKSLLELIITLRHFFFDKQNDERKEEGKKRRISLGYISSKYSQVCHFHREF